MNSKISNKKRVSLIVLLLGLSLLAMLLSLRIGSAPISVGDLVNIMMGRGDRTAPLLQSILLEVRMPRIFLSFLVGLGLGASGTVMQSLLQNPLASSYTLGVSSGASLGASAVMLLGINFMSTSVMMSIGGFSLGLLTVFVVLLFAQHFSQALDNQTIILVGMVLSLFINSFLTLLMTFSPDYMQRIIFWQLGSFSGASWENVKLLSLTFIFSFLCLIYFHREMDILSFGDVFALSQGVEVKRTKIILIGLSTLLTGASVALTGVIGFVDLVAPHVARRLFGATHRWVLPSSALVGGLLCVLADTVARSILQSRELPIGAVTALIGAPFFCYIFFRKGQV
ncbi:FecCD family ABC transporter permease [Lactococcus formosensis]|uniref:FecCD family ABC transporter permease n=1 Tax=Lactococcus formosensis TaxID=1281486 RepID=UPI001BCB4DD9|nr:iron ABC transporter permease [Lactococcus formosensis]MCO7181037.1 iron ABC transporter permease [Lactococcus formosensis]MDG6112128.1 iron ABC transporter permease [Lactococcus formosensis]MDG6118379.1 iron ABC transporter permease [Lactococcus formosensis]MDG6120389.1 iron ABC transporter permease [Lactococcus formosensis]MDG6139237.1 iron ABC transporter permease [Lactococcus formosensis]